MSRTLVGITTFGNLDFTKLAVDSIRETTFNEIEFFIVIGKPGDSATKEWLQGQSHWHGDVSWTSHDQNRGFPACINDIYDFAWPSLAEPKSRWNHPEFDNLIIAGNDIIAYPGAVDALIECADTTDWEWICSSQFDVKSLYDRYPEVRHLFEGPNMIFSRFDQRPWKVHEEFRAPAIEPNVIKDVRNLCLFKRSVHETIGYADINFWPGGYFEDNDYCRRANKAGVKGCGLAHSAYFHFWSRTIHQGTGSTTSMHFERNESYYKSKWGGPVNGEAYDSPFNGSAPLRIPTRHQEPEIVKYWSTR